MKKFGLLITAILFLSSFSFSQVVISQVYGGGGNAGSTYTNDFIELFNSGSTTVGINGWSVQYASGTGTTWAVTNLTNVTLQPGQYYLIQEAQGSGGTVPLPTPDATGIISMSATVGKVALVNITTALIGTCPSGSGIIDFVGFGNTANCYEGTGTTPAPSNTLSVLRLSDGCRDDNNNSTDFVTGAPTPRNTSFTFNICSDPLINTSISILPDFNYEFGTGPSISESYNLSGTDLTPITGNLTVTGSVHYEVSLDDATFNNSMDVAYSGGSSSATPIYVRLKAGLSVGNYDGEFITNSGGGSVNVLVTCNGDVSTPVPVELTSFSAATIGSGIKLSWNTATEVNNYGFEVERKVGSLQSTVGNYEKISFVNGNGNSNSPKSYSYEDKNVTVGKHSYRLKQIDNDGQFEYSKAIEVDFNTAKKFELSQNYPNPFNPATTIRFNLPEAGNVKITLYNLLGQEIRTFVNGYKESGVHTINFSAIGGSASGGDASDLNSGMYIYKLESGSLVQTRKMMLLK